jgi:UDP-N-acetylglucosamine--N-acetylmuramyl-(pentapeptide) pyrophosphoryl-undecaprenol N-acetylglucosamine transferase
MERSLVAKESHLPFRAIPAAAVRGRNPLALARNSLTLLRGTMAAMHLIRRERPGAILGTGGYVCVPLFVAARLLRTPTIIYLPDIVPGLAVRFLSRLATITAANVEDSAPFLQKKVYDVRQGSVQSKQVLPDIVERQKALHIVGYPVRADLIGLDRQACRAAFQLRPELPVVLVYGGSRGARSINQAIAALLEPLLRQAQVLHICGREGDDAFLQTAVQRVAEPLRANYHLFPYLHASEQTADGKVQPSMAQAFGAADLAICRSGASTLAELPAVGLPAVLVPYPYVHQEENADYLVRHGAAVKVLDNAMLGTGQPEEGVLFQQVSRLLERHDERKQMALRSCELARPGAAERLAVMLLELASRSV